MMDRYASSATKEWLITFAVKFIFYIGIPMAIGVILYHVFRAFP